MKLTHSCPKCGKPATIQSEFPMGNLVNYIYRCGHLELRKKFITNTSEETSKAKETSEASQVKNLNAELLKAGLNSHIIVNSDNTINNDKTATQVLEIKSPEPTHKELYEDLDAWVSDGGKVKGIGDNWVDILKPHINSSYYGTDSRKCAYQFQREGVAFAESTQLRCLIADAMGLGKTIQALISIKRNKVISYPCLAIVKGATTFQWAKEYGEWVSHNFTSCMPITSRSHIIPGFDFYILSMDMIGKQDIIEKLLTLGIKSIIIDECQNFKDPNAKRTEGLIKFIKLGKIEYIIALSGTPIKNRVGEYGVILNLLAPGYFPNSTLERYWFKPEEKITSSGRMTTVYQRLNPMYVDRFKEVTSKFILRRERHDVLTNLPPLTRDYQIIEIDDVAIKNTYNRTLDLFKNWLSDNKSGANSTQLLGWLAQLRAITGQAKCKNALEWTKDFIESTEESLAIGIHHQSVRDTLYLILEGMGVRPLKLSGEDSVYRKADIVRRFTQGDNRILVINSIAGGVGLNLQTCAQALVLERQWNSADEEQFEARFHRDGQQKAVTITYMIAKGTIDEFFHEMVEKKRRILVEAGIGTSWDLGSDIESLLDLSNQIVSHKI